MVIDSWRLQRRWRRLQRPVAAVLIALGGAGLWLRSSGPIATVPVLVAVADVPAGAIVGAEDVAVVAWPADTHPPPAQGSPDLIVGRRATAAIRSGEALTAQRVVGPDSLRDVGPDHVAVALPPDALSASGLVRPGDRVNLVGRTDAGPRTLAAGASVLTLAAEKGAVVAVPAAAAPSVVQAAATDSISMVLLASA
jgi:Flp pilus assembly protein CpaB